MICHWALGIGHWALGIGHWAWLFPLSLSSSPVPCLVNIVCGLIAYCHQFKKPAIAIDRNLLLAA
ncbi:hypothetical protein [Nostoc sp. LPT]|uniref:hypothetical protein n=1 Tax=Nostoc sp. LPT TaxID=2815387 RepID=UPI001DC5259A|nr:hypothetical protein [Nostoc sp. LPT]MBN4004453.1 hypothetical protein [Nostoc sp. LPT]